MFNNEQIYLGALSNNLDIYSLSDYPTNPYSFFYALDPLLNTLFGALFSYDTDLKEWIIGTSYIQRNFLSQDVSSVGFSFLNNIPFIVGLLLCGSTPDGNIIALSQEGVSIYKPDILLYPSSEGNLDYYNNFKVKTITTYNYIPFLYEGFDDYKYNILRDNFLYHFISEDFIVILKKEMLGMLVINKRTQSIIKYNIPDDMLFWTGSPPTMYLKENILYLFNYSHSPIVGIDLNSMSIKYYPILPLPKIANPNRFDIGSIFDTGSELLIVYSNDKSNFYDVGALETHVVIASISYSLTEVKKVYYDDMIIYDGFRYYLFQTANGSVVFGGHYVE